MRSVSTFVVVYSIALLFAGFGSLSGAAIAAEAPISGVPAPEEESAGPAELGTVGASVFDDIKRKADETFEPGKSSEKTGIPAVTAQTGPVTQAQLERQFVTHYTNTINMYREIWLSIGVLFFGAVTLGIECYLIRRDPKSWDGPATLRMIIITLIIISGSFLITSGYSNDQIVPIVGLLGSIAGYLLGKTDAQPAPPTNGGGGGGV